MSGRGGREQRGDGHEDGYEEAAAVHDEAETLVSAESRAAQVGRVSAKTAASVTVPSVSQVT